MPLEPLVTDTQLCETSSRMSTSAIETITNDAPRTRSEAMPIGTATRATRTPETTSATHGSRSWRVISSAVP